MSRYASIPEPGETLEAMRDTVRALKQVVEQLANLRGAGHTPRVFYQIDPPSTEDCEEGDFWIRQDTTELLYFNHDSIWVAPA